VNPTYPADDFNLQPGSPGAKIGFVQFDPKLAGRLTTPQPTVVVPASFPTSPILPQNY